MQLFPVAYAERKSVLPKNIFLSVIYILVLLLVAVAAISFFSAWKITHPNKVTTPQISSNIAPDYNNISFTVGESKEKINGWFFHTVVPKKLCLWFMAMEKTGFNSRNKPSRLLQVLIKKDLM